MYYLLKRVELKGIPFFGLASKENRRITIGVEGLFVVSNRSREVVLAEKVRLADTPGSRRTGLLKHKTLAGGEGLWIFPTQAIHTFGMRFPIDVAFLDRRLRVKRTYHNLAPCRMTRLVWGARSALELAPGILAGSGTRVGDQLHFSAGPNKDDLSCCPEKKHQNRS